MAGWTNKGKYKALGVLFRAQALPTNFYVALVTSAVAPTQDTNTLSQLTEITPGNGYVTGGFSLTPGSTDFDVWTEDDTADDGEVQIKDVSWTASAGSIPGSGSGARYAVLTDDNVTVGSREVWKYWDLTSDRSVGSGATLTLQDLTSKLTET